MSIRAALALVMAGLAGMAAVAATCLLIVTSRLDRQANSLGAAADGIRNAQALEIMLLRHARIRAEPPELRDREIAAERTELEGTISHLFSEASTLAGGPQDRALVEDARGEVEQYLAADEPVVAEQSLQRALAALSALVSFNLTEVDQAKADAAAWNRTGDAAAAVVALLLLVVTAATLVWLHMGVFRPLLRLRTSIDDFGGNHALRLADFGPGEVRAIANAFNQMADRLDQQRERQLTFIAAVVHDLRNPMGPLKMAADHLAQGQGADRVEQLGGMMLRQVGQLERLTTDLLDAARIEAGQLELRVQPCDLRESVSSIVELFRAQPDGDRVSALLPSEPIVVDGDPGRLQQVVGNLVSNALKYSPDGGYVELRLSADDHHATIEVTDQGVGIDEADLPHIFEPFRRAERSSHTVPGVGLGLSISRRIIAAHGGRIDVRSSAGVGSTFTVVLPRK